MKRKLAVRKKKLGGTLYLKYRSRMSITLGEVPLQTLQQGTKSIRH